MDDLMRERGKVQPQGRAGVAELVAGPLCLQPATGDGERPRWAIRWSDYSCAVQPLNV